MVTNAFSVRGEKKEISYAKEADGRTDGKSSRRRRAVIGFDAIERSCLSSSSAF